MLVRTITEVKHSKAEKEHKQKQECRAPADKKAYENNYNCPNGATSRGKQTVRLKPLAQVHIHRIW